MDIDRPGRLSSIPATEHMVPIRTVELCKDSSLRLYGSAAQFPQYLLPAHASTCHLIISIHKFTFLSHYQHLGGQYRRTLDHDPCM